ncbi:MAG: tetratricopeptide repeat protein, partial [Bacteroidota bacterium]
DTTQAINDLDKAVKIDSNYVQPYIYRGQIYHSKGQYEMALKDYNLAIENEPKNTRALINRSMTYSEINELEKAMADLNKVIETDPSNSLAYYNRALLRTQIENYDKAIEDYDQVLKYNPQNILSYFNRGIVHMEKESYGKAVRDFSLAIRFYPEFAKAYMNRAIARERLQDYEGAQNDREKAQQIFAAYQKNELKQINFADTSENFRRLISLQNSQGLPKQFGNADQTIEPFGLYSLYYKNGNTDNITETISQYLKEETQNPSLEFLDENFVFDYSNNSETSPEEHLRQIERLKDSIKQNPSLWRLKYKTALLESYRKNYNSAITDMSEIIDENQPENFLAYFSRANIRYRMIEYIKMMEDDSKIIQIDLDNKFIEQPITEEVTFHDYKKVIEDYN